MKILNWARAVALGAAVLAGPAAAQSLPGRDQGPAFAAVLEALGREAFGQASALAARVPDPAAAVYADWRNLSRGDAGFEAYRRFLAAYPDWPEQDRLRRRAEQAMPSGLPAADVLAFFEPAAPSTGTGALRLAEAQQAAGRSADAAETARRAWRELSLTTSEEQALLSRYGGVVSADHWARADMLLWRGLSGEASRMVPRLDAGRAALVRARIALREGRRGVNALIDQVPASLSGDGGLAYERFRWRDRRDMDAGAEEMIRAASASAQALGRPAVWASRRRSLVRRAERAGRAAVAYELASRHHTRPSDGYAHADLEWLSGWIALRRLNDPSRAEAHFARFIEAVTTPISYGRGWYWLGRAREARGDAPGAQAAYRECGRWQTSFYGQLAAQKAGLTTDPALAGVAAPTDWRAAAILRSELVRAGVLAHHAGERRRAHWLLTHAATQAATPRDLAALGALALELRRPEVAVRVAKAAARDGLVLPTPYYPVTDLAQASGRVAPSEAMAIARQESELNPDAVSPAGARGLMQVMPATAQQVSRKLGLAYSRGALTADWRYNARLGTDYLADLLDEFGHLPLAAAGYNAGPHRSRQWIQRFGDPRGMSLEQAIDWMERIPFNETRNYVQRVVESVQVYESRIAGAPAPLLTAQRVAR
ncbi:MAG: lytic transglycosylase domain-containing protein [Pseudomonadota bacterium]